MNKFKKVMLGALSVLTLGLFAVVGTKVDAESNQYQYGSTNTGWTVYNEDSNASTFEASKSFDSAAHTIKKLKNDGTITSPTFGTAASSVVVDVIVGSKDGKQKSFLITPYSGDVALSTGEVTGWTGASGELKQGYTVKDSKTNGTFTLSVENQTITKFVVKNNSGNNLCFYSISYTTVDAAVKTNAEKIAEAKTAIKAIGNVTYTSECLELIQAASLKVNACDNGVADLNVAYEDDATKNYKTVYESSVTAFETAESNAMKAFTDAVDEIAPVTASSGEKIEAAESAYAVLFGTALTDSDVTSAKTSLDTYKIEYKEAIYDSLDKSFSTNDDSSITSTSVTLSSEQQLGSSIFTATKGISKQDNAMLKIDETTWNARYYTGGNSTCKSDKIERVFYFTAKTSGTLKIAASSQNASEAARKVDVYNESYSKIASAPAQISDSNNNYIYLNIPSSGKYYIGSTGGVNFFYLEFIPETTYIANDISLSFDAQYDTEEDDDATKLRFIGTIDGVAYTDYDKISKMEFTFTFNGSNRACEATKLYKSIVSGTDTIKSTKEKTLYVVYQLNNINKEAYKTKKMTNCKFVITFIDGSKVSINHAEITLPTFTSVIA